MLATLHEIVRFQHLIDRAVHFGEGAFKAALFGVGIFGDQLLDLEAALVAHGQTHRETAVETQPVNADGLTRHTVERRMIVPAFHFGRGDYFRRDHRDGLKRFDFLAGILAPRAILHREHADHAPRSDDRHAGQRMINFFAGFRPVGEGRMALRVGQGQGSRALRQRRK